jgi:hypothetical protein
MVLLGHMADLFLVFYHTVFYSGYTSLHSTSSVWGSFIPTSLLTFVVFVFLMVAILTGVRWNHNVVLICVSFMDKGYGGFPHVFFSHLDFFLWKGSVRFISHFFLGSLIFWEFSVLSSLMFWLSTPCQRYSWQTFSPILWMASTI